MKLFRRGRRSGAPAPRPPEPEKEPAAGFPSGEGSSPAPSEKIPVPRGLADFALRTMPLALGHGQENTLYSPVSLWLHLSMLSVCTGGTCRDRILDVLGADSEQARTVAGGLDRCGDALSFAASLWTSDRIPASAFHGDTLNILADSFHADTHPVPMGTVQAERAVADWIREKTGMSAGSRLTRPDTVLLLLSAMHYRAPWVEPFSPGSTATDRFFCADGRTEKIPFMHRTGYSHWRQEETWTAASLPLNPGTLTFVLPSEGCRPEDLLNSPDILRAAAGGDGFHLTRVRWSVPRFESRSSLSLSSLLEKLGCGILFQDGADFHPLSSLPIALSDIRQDAQITVNEQGAEASAISLSNALLGFPSTPKNMVLSRPFLFLLSLDGIPLMCGVFRRP